RKTQQLIFSRVSNGRHIVCNADHRRLHRRVIARPLERDRSTRSRKRAAIVNLDAVQLVFETAEATRRRQQTGILFRFGRRGLRIACARTRSCDLLKLRKRRLTCEWSSRRTARRAQLVDGQQLYLPDVLQPGGLVWSIECDFTNQRIVERGSFLLPRVEVN